MVHMVATNAVSNLELGLNARACHRCRSFNLIRRLSHVPFQFCPTKSTTGNDVLLIFVVENILQVIPKKKNNKHIEKIKSKIFYMKNSLFKVYYGTITYSIQLTLPLIRIDSTQIQIHWMHCVACTSTGHPSCTSSLLHGNCCHNSVMPITHRF